MSEEKTYPMITDNVKTALTEIQEPNGMYELYDTTLSRIEDILFINSDDIGLSDSDALSILRVLRLLRHDLRRLATTEEQSEEADVEDEGN